MPHLIVFRMRQSKGVLTENWLNKHKFTFHFPAPAWLALQYRILI